MNHRDVHRVRAIELTPWCRAALGDLHPAMPRGYRILGDAVRAAGPYRLRLFRAGAREPIAEHEAVRPDIARTMFDALVDLAWIDHRERSVTVTADADGFVTAIEGGAA